jgi:hypothetical protein
VLRGNRIACREGFLDGFVDEVLLSLVRIVGVGLTIYGIGGSSRSGSVHFFQDFLLGSEPVFPLLALGLPSASQIS